MSIKTKTDERLTRRPCDCCGVFHDPNICAQCQVAGCAANGKKDKCRLQTSLLEARKLSQFQLETENAELKKNYAELLAESQRLARIVCQHQEIFGPPSDKAAELAKAAA